ncbi:hypothetical protein CRG98_015431 [Punica granatum]|uniref:Uncharacterized protein n=1 Tax=Punica granatum TaxID=22663 RepID=A0A2I0K8W1_PUNGR|nr:hypothetical protein CRG98_015431 [Punica granatum]
MGIQDLNNLELGLVVSRSAKDTATDKVVQRRCRAPPFSLIWTFHHPPNTTSIQVSTGDTGHDRFQVVFWFTLIAVRMVLFRHGQTISIQSRLRVLISSLYSDESCGYATNGLDP